MLVDDFGLAQIFQFQAATARYQHYLGVQEPADPQITALLVAFSAGNETTLWAVTAKLSFLTSRYAHFRYIAFFVTLMIISNGRYEQHTRFCYFG